MSSPPISLTDAPEKTPLRRDPYAAFRHKSYRHFVLGRVVFMIGSQMQATAVGWQIYERLGSKLALAYVGLVQILPILFLSVPFGHLSDRFNRKYIVMAGQGLFLLSSLGLAAVSHARGDPRLIYVFLFLLAVARSLTMPAMGAMLPTLIPKTSWASAATWNSSVFELTGMAGPAVAGLVIAASRGATTVYLTAAGCSVVCLLIFSFLRPAQVIAPRKSATWNDVLGGIRFVFKTRLLLSAASLDLFAVLLGGATALLPVVAKDILHVGPVGFGWLQAAPSIGAISMAFVTAHLPPWRHAGRVLLGALTGFGLAIIVFGFSRNFWLSMSMLVLTGVFDNLNVVIRQTLVQFITPDEMRGRVTSVNFIFIGCSNQLGAFESGLTAQFFGTVPSIVGGGVGTLLVVLAVMKLSPPLRRLGRLQEIQPAPA